ncbi:trans-aconitate 2-methyltransferase [Congregibacter sp.]|uniref:trans-aconitate 2-methyltransferase n=1 Tax=Congregibacter sp. TaxID=2744308 RepID=UPI003F6D462D
MSDWNAAHYDNFADQRQQAVTDLITALPGANPTTIADLGCGSGLSTSLLAERWADAAIHGIDQSPAMLARAKHRVPKARFSEGDIARFAPAQASDMLFANASLHWLPEHRALLPRLMATLAPGGVLALQMPNNLEEPSHRLMRDVAESPDYAGHLEDFSSSRGALLSPREYYECLSPLCESLRIWETHYHHPLSGPEEIVAWFKTTGLKPFLDMLPASKQNAFEADYLERISMAYPRLSDGSVMLRLPRLFIIAKKGMGQGF